MIRIQRKGASSTGVLKTSGHRRADFSGFTSGAGGSGAGGAGGSSGGAGFGASGGSGLNTLNTFTPVMDFLDEGSVIELWLSRAPERLHRLCRRIYAEDAVAGQAVDIYKDLPWSEFQLTGIKDTAIQNFYVDALNAINAAQLLPEATQEYLVMGKDIGHMIMDDRKGYFTRVIIQNPDYIRVTPAPLAGFSPKLDIIPSPDLLRVLESKDARDKELQQHLGPFAALIRNKKEVPLPPANSFYLARKMSPYDTIGASIYTRIFALVAYEKALTNATLTTAQRRMSRIRHMVLGEENWMPTDDEMNAYADLFMDAEKDPVGALVATRTGVVVNEVGGNTLSDIIKLGDEWPFLTTAKMNALGISETLLSGEASYNSMEQVLGVFLDRLRALRLLFVHNLLFDQILKPLAKKHGYIHQSQARLAHRIRVTASADDRTDYILPSLVFDKKLRPTENKDFLEVLTTLEEKGFPITARTWFATAGVDLNTEVEQQAEDVDIRRGFAQYKSRLDSVGGGGDGGESAEDSGTEDLGAELSASTSAKMAAVAAVSSLPHMVQGEFLGVTKTLLLERAERTAAFMGGRSRKKFSLAQYMEILTTGNPNADVSLRYLLARAGILQGVTITNDFMSDAMRRLASMGLHPDILATEALALHTMAETKSEPVATRPTKRRELPAGQLLTGYMPKVPDQDNVITPIVGP